MNDYLEFKGRAIDGVPYTGLLESLTIIGLMASAGVETEAHLSKADLVNIMRQIFGEHAKALAFAGATEAEAKVLTRHFMKTMRTTF